MKALVWHGTDDVRVERVPDPTILGGRDAIVKITATTDAAGTSAHAGPRSRSAIGSREAGRGAATTPA